MSPVWSLLLFLVQLNSANDDRMLLAPTGVDMDSVNMRHVLRWRPPQAVCNTTLLYSVQYQGDFERIVRGDQWLNTTECQQITQPSCNLTPDLGSDSDYNLQVRAQCGSKLSPWTKLNQLFNRRDTVLMVPTMMVSVVGDALVVTFDKVPLTASIRVTLWKRGDEQQPMVYTLPAGHTELHVASLQETVEYCIQAQMFLDAQFYSNSTGTECVSTTGPDDATKKPISVVVTVVIMAVLFFAVFWAIVHYRANTSTMYVKNAPLPPWLTDWDIQSPMSVQEEEACAPVCVVVSDETTT